jgi:type I restriction enzyme S subunit
MNTIKNRNTELPEGWEESTLEKIVNCNGGVSFSPSLQGRTDGKIPFYKVSDMNLPGNSLYMDKANNYISEEDLLQLRSKLFPENSIIFPKVGGALLTNKKRILSKPALVDNNVMVVSLLENASCISEFIYLYFESIDLKNLAVPGPLPSINSTSVYEQSILLPPLPEQKIISNILFKIKQAIETQDEIIKSTQALKKSTMQHLFTHGLYGEPTKQTEIGEVPITWEVKPISHIAKVQGGYAFKSEDYIKNGIRIFRISNVSFGKTSWDDVSFLPESYIDKFSDYVLKPGDLVIALTRPIVSGGIKITRLDMSDCPSLLNQRVARFITSSKINIEYLFQIIFNTYFINSIVIGALGSQQPNISTSQIENIQIPIPDIKEQNKIAVILQNIDKKLKVIENKKQILNSLFQSMLNKLMLGEIRLKTK